MGKIAGVRETSSSDRLRMNLLKHRFLLSVFFITLCLVALCVFTAVSLFRQQSVLAEVLRENVASRRAAVELEECLADLVALENASVETVAPLHDRANQHLQGLRDVANEPEELRLSAQLDRSYAEYLRLWKHLPPAGTEQHEAFRLAATSFLDREILKPCAEFRQYNGMRLEESTNHHERVLRQLAWGMAGIGGIAGVAGVVLGFGVARGLSKSIHHLQVRIRDAAGLLSHPSPEIVLTGLGGFKGLDEQMDELTDRIEETVSQLQQREREVLRAEQLAATGQLAAGVGHEIRNPLTSIKMLVQSALEDEDASLTPKDLRVIEGEVRRMERSLQAFLAFARPPQAERKRTDLRTVMESTLGLIRGRIEKQRVEAKLEAPPGSLSLIADPVQLQQVMVNLGLNALDAMPTGGRLTIRILRIANRYEIEVADTGPGISKEILPRLFQPFASDKETGVGLGLVISRRIIEEHGGTLGAANRLGGGATFFINLPIGNPPGEPRA